MKEDLKMQSVKFIFIGMLFFGLFTGCNGQKKATMENTKMEASADSPLTLVVEGNYAPTDSVETHVIKNAKELSKFFSRVNRTRKPGIPVPEVDFAKDMVIIYCAGVAGNGTEPRLVISEESEAELVLGMDNFVNKEKQEATVSPFRVYTMPLTSKELRFMTKE